MFNKTSSVEYLKFGEVYYDSSERSYDQNHILTIQNDTLTFSSTQYPGDFSGTGDIFSAAVTAFLTTGCGLSESISRTISFIEKSVRETLTHPHDTNDGTDFQLFLKEI